MLGREPTIIIQSVVAVLNAIQIAAISMPIWAHTVIAVTVIALGALLNRAEVTPWPVPLPPPTPAPAPVKGQGPSAA